VAFNVPVVLIIFSIEPGFMSVTETGTANSLVVVVGALLQAVVAPIRAIKAIDGKKFFIF
jgi:hypothetical protein